jgi:hypothetical protein
MYTVCFTSQSFTLSPSHPIFTRRTSGHCLGTLKKKKKEYILSLPTLHQSLCLLSLSPFEGIDFQYGKAGKRTDGSEFECTNRHMINEFVYELVYVLGQCCPTFLCTRAQLSSSSPLLPLFLICSRKRMPPLVPDSLSCFKMSIPRWSGGGGCYPSYTMKRGRSLTPKQ